MYPVTMSYNNVMHTNSGLTINKVNIEVGPSLVNRTTYIDEHKRCEKERYNVYKDSMIMSIII